MHHFVFQFLWAQRSLRRQFFDKIKIVHYTLQKPWLSNTVSGGSTLWWHQFVAVHPKGRHRLAPLTA